MSVNDRQEPVATEPAGAIWRGYAWHPAGDDALTAEAFAWADDTGVRRGSGAFGYFVRAYIAGAQSRRAR